MSLPFAEWLPRQRWYAGRSRELSAAEPARVVPLRDDIELMLVDASYIDGSSERYQVIVRWDVAPPDEYNTVATIGSRLGSHRVRRALRPAGGTVPGPTVAARTPRSRSDWLEVLRRTHAAERADGPREWDGFGSRPSSSVVAPQRDRFIRFRWIVDLGAAQPVASLTRLIDSNLSQ